MEDGPTTWRPRRLQREAQGAEIRRHTGWPRSRKRRSEVNAGVDGQQRCQRQRVRPTGRMALDRGPLGGKRRGLVAELDAFRQRRCIARVPRRCLMQASMRAHVWSRRAGVRDADKQGEHPDPENQKGERGSLSVSESHGVEPAAGRKYTNQAGFCHLLSINKRLQAERWRRGGRARLSNATPLDLRHDRSLAPEVRCQDALTFGGNGRCAERNGSLRGDFSRSHWPA
jgi:hypothetical protein